MALPLLGSILANLIRAGGQVMASRAAGAAGAAATSAPVKVAANVSALPRGVMAAPAVAGGAQPLLATGVRPLGQARLQALQSQQAANPQPGAANFPGSPSGGGGGSGSGGEGDGLSTTKKMLLIMTGIAGIGTLAGAAIKSWTERLVESRRELARFSPLIAQSVARLDRQQIILGRQSAQATGGTTRFAANGLMGLRNELQPLLDAGTSIKNVIAGTLIRGVTGILKSVNTLAQPILKGVAILEEWFGEDQKNAKMPLESVTEAALKGQWGKPRNKRPGEN